MNIDNDNCGLDKGEILKEVGIERVIDNEPDWHASAIAQIHRIPRGFELTGEDIRRIVQNACGNPRSPNSWGALVNSAAKTQLIIDTGRVGRCKIPSNHHRRVTVWKRL